MRLELWIASLVAIVSGLPGSARAQAVGTAEEKALEPRGIYAGGFRLYPELDAATEYNDNVLADNADKREDIIATITPRARLQSQWGENALNIDLQSSSRVYANEPKQDTTDAKIEASGYADLSRNARISGTASYGALHESLLYDPAGAGITQPTSFDRAAGALSGYRAFNFFKLIGEANYEKLDYHDNVLQSGAVYDVDDRDAENVSLLARGEFSIGRAQSLFGSLSTNQHNFRLKPSPTNGVTTNRNSSGVEALVGLNLELTRLFTGQIAAGYFDQDYSDPSVGAVSGLSVRTRLDWYPDSLVKLNINLSRGVQDASVSGAAAYIATDASVGAEYYFRRNITFRVDAGYNISDYKDITRQDKRWSGGAEVEYTLNRGIACFAKYRRNDQRSSGFGSGRDYDVNSAVFGLRLRR
jgi:hypothetical protein